MFLFKGVLVGFYVDTAITSLLIINVSHIIASNILQKYIGKLVYFIDFGSVRTLWGESEILCVLEET